MFRSIQENIIVLIVTYHFVMLIAGISILHCWFYGTSMKFWRQISKSGGGNLLIRSKISMLVQHCTTFSRIFFLKIIVQDLYKIVQRYGKSLSIIKKISPSISEPNKGISTLVSSSVIIS